MRAQRGNLLTGTKPTSPVPVILGLVPRILFQQGINLVNKLALLLNKCWLTQDTRNKSEYDWCWGRGFGTFSQSGRSMIEMLGVLAIIGVLSVGGIAGYSKAMEKYKVNKALEGYSMLVFGILEHIDDLRKSTADNTNIDAETLLAINAVPQSWVKNGYYNILDSYNNQTKVWLHEGKVTIDIYLSAPAANTDGNSVTENTSVTLCRELFTNLFLPLHAEALYTSVYTTSKGNYAFYGDKYCKDGQKRCMSNATPVQINEACNYCGKTGDFCNFNILF